MSEKSNLLVFGDEKEQVMEQRVGRFSFQLEVSCMNRHRMDKYMKVNLLVTVLYYGNSVITLLTNSEEPLGPRGRIREYM